MTAALMVALLGLPEFKAPLRLWALLALPVLIILYVLLLRLKGLTGIRYTNTAIIGGARLIDSSAPNATTRFYRVREE